MDRTRPNIKLYGCCLPYFLSLREMFDIEILMKRWLNFDGKKKDFITFACGQKTFIVLLNVKDMNC